MLRQCSATRLPHLEARRLCAPRLTAGLFAFESYKSRRTDTLMFRHYHRCPMLWPRILREASVFATSLFRTFPRAGNELPRTPYLLGTSVNRGHGGSRRSAWCSGPAKNLRRWRCGRSRECSGRGGGRPLIKGRSGLRSLLGGRCGLSRRALSFGGGGEGTGAVVQGCVAGVECTEGQCSLPPRNNASGSLGLLTLSCPFW